MFDKYRDRLYTQDKYATTYQRQDAEFTDEELKELAELGIETSWQSTCVACQLRQRIKYAGTINSKGERTDGWAIKCKGIVAQLPRGSSKLVSDLIAGGMEKERALLTLKATIDPVSWCEMMFGFDDAKRGDGAEWYIYPYQKEQIRCTSRLSVVRQGRRTGKTFGAALKLLYLAFNMKVSAGYNSEGVEEFSGPTIMVVTPYQAQLTNLFDEMEKLIKKSKDLTSRVTTGTSGSLYVKTPNPHMELSNGANINGFVSGIGSRQDGSGGGTMRGQAATVIYLDEMDMIPDEVLEKVVMPIMLSDREKKIMLIATSTPIGKRSKFYNWCKNDPSFKEDYLPSTVLPQWEEIEPIIKAESTPENFESEYLAKFIDGAYGIFPPQLIQACKKDYKYEDIADPKWWLKNGILDKSKLIINIGIDWNKNAGSEFFVVGYDPTHHRYISLEAVNVPASEFSSVRWKEEVIRLNYKWDPTYIYADEGYGHTIIEDLKVLAYELRGKAGRTLREQATAKLVERLVSFNFSSKVTLRNPIDGTELEKSGKDFLVETAIRILEDKIFWMPVGETQLQKELSHYVVLRRAPTTNKPVYGTDNNTIGDHRLDAWMLAIGGIQLEQGLYSKGAMSYSKPGFVSKEEAAEHSKVSLGAQLINHLQKVPFAAPTSLEVLEIERTTGARPSKPPIVERRGRHSEQEDTFKKQMLSEAYDSRGYATDTEHLYNNDRPSAWGPRKRSRRGWRK